MPELPVRAGGHGKPGSPFFRLARRNAISTSPPPQTPSAATQANGTPAPIVRSTMPIDREETPTPQLYC